MDRLLDNRRNTERWDEPDRFGSGAISYSDKPGRTSSSAGGLLTLGNVPSHLGHY
jgi:hypothetical protein